MTEFDRWAQQKGLAYDSEDETPAPTFEEPKAKPTECPHMSFQTHARIGRLSDTEGGPVTGYTADIKIECVDCGLPFRFRGLAAGSHYAEPRVSVDGTELRAPLEPAYTVEICGQPIISGRA